MQLRTCQKGPSIFKYGIILKRVLVLSDVVENGKSIEVCVNNKCSIRRVVREGQSPLRRSATQKQWHLLEGRGCRFRGVRLRVACCQRMNLNVLHRLNLQVSTTQEKVRQLFPCHIIWNL
jgi:hypothetical protein